MPSSLPPAAKLFIARMAPWLSIAIGAVLIYRGSQDLARAEKTAGWAGTPGRILASRVEQFSRQKGDTTYRPLVLYEYRVNTAVLHGTRLGLADRQFRNQTEADAVAARYPVGREVTVYYNPFLPTEAVLEVGSPREPYGYLGAGGFCILVGLSLAAILARGGRARGLAQRSRRQSSR